MTMWPCCRCAISRVTNQLLYLTPVWKVDDKDKLVRLVGFHCITERMRTAQRELLLPGELPAETADAFCEINGWTMRSVRRYRTRQMQLLSERRMGNWRVVVESSELLT